MVHISMLYTDRLPLKDKHLPTVATYYMQHYLNSVATELVPLVFLYISMVTCVTWWVTFTL